MLELAQTTTLLQESNTLSHGVARRNWPKQLPIKASVVGFPNDKCQCPQEQNIMKDGDWCGFGTLICAWAGKHNLHLLYLSTAPQLLRFFLLVVKSMQILDCLVPFFYFPPPLGQKKCIVLVCQSSFGLIVFTGRIQHPCSWYARTVCTIHPQSPSFPDETKIPSCI